MRFTVLLTFFTFLYSSLIFNIYGLQVEKGSYYSARAESQNRLAGFLGASRGRIYFIDKNNNKVPAAINKEYPVVYAVPKEIADPAGAAEKLSAVFNSDKKDLEESLSKSKSLYALIYRKATPEQTGAVKNLNIKGIYIDEENLRYYPFGNLASQVLGFLSPSAEDALPSGKYGIESQFDKLMSGVSGKVDGDKIIEAEPGQDVALTIDPNIQTKAEDILNNLIKKFSATGGTVIVEDPQTGKILAMGSSPSFDPNNYSASEMKDFMNPAVQATYEPGSIFKVITMSAGIDSRKITPETSFVDVGSVTLDGKTIKNWDLKAHGRVTMTEVIEQSINTGAVFAERKTGKDIFYSYLDKFGFNGTTGIELPGERTGNLGNLRTSFREINFATASFGQGVAITPIQLISAISAIANGGFLKKPFIVAGTEEKILKQVISKDTSDKVKEMMVSAVRKAEVAQIPNYKIAGKTGTAQIPDLKNGGYEKDYIHTYVGFAPASSPRFIVLIKIDRPNVTLAGATVVPAFRELAEFILNYYNIPPDNLATSD